MLSLQILFVTNSYSFIVPKFVVEVCSIISLLISLKEDVCDKLFSDYVLIPINQVRIVKIMKIPKLILIIFKNQE